MEKGMARHILATIRKPYFRYIGEWDLDHEQESIAHGYEEFSYPLIFSVVALKSFIESFHWCTPRSVETSISEPSTVVSWQQQETIDVWLESLFTYGGICRGLVAEFDLEAYWYSEDGELIKTLIPGGLQVLHSIDSFPVFGESITIWPNIFTNMIKVYPQGSITYQCIPVLEAARRNRALLRTSLHAWEHASGGRICHWYSEMVETGIERYGFSENATVC